MSPLLDRDTRAARVVASLANPDHVFRPGSFVTAEIPLSRDHAEVLVRKPHCRRSRASAWCSCATSAASRPARSPPAAKTIAPSRSFPACLPARPSRQQHLRSQSRAGQGGSRAPALRDAVISRIIDFPIRRRWFVLLAALAACGSAALGRAYRSTRCPTSPTTRCRSTPCAGALAGRNRKAGHLPHRDRARRHAGPRIYPLAVAQRLLAGDRGVRREDQHLFRPPADQRAPARNSQQSSARRRAEDRAGLHRLGEIYVDGRVRAAPREQGADGRPGWQSDGAYLTPEGQRLGSELERAAYLRTVQDWIIRPQLKSVPGVAGWMRSADTSSSTTSSRTPRS